MGDIEVHKCKDCRHIRLAGIFRSCNEGVWGIANNLLPKLYKAVTVLENLDPVDMIGRQCPKFGR